MSSHVFVWRPTFRRLREWARAPGIVLIAAVSLLGSCTANIEGPAGGQLPETSTNGAAGGGLGPGNAVICPANMIACGAACVSLQSDSANCGACGKACSPPATCSNGSCTTGCAAGLQLCGAACVSLMSDAAHCGSCEKACAASEHCNAGVCGCAAGETLCGDKCVSTSTTVEHCGGCGMACAAGQSCAAGKCVIDFGDACTNTQAGGISIREIAIYQAGKIPIMKAGAAISEDDRPADVIQGKAGRLRVFVDLDSAWSNRTVSARLLLSNGGALQSYVSKRNVTQPSTESSFETTFNFDVKPADIADTTRYSVEIVECDGAASGAAGKARFPATDSQELGTRKTGVIKIRFIPLDANGRLAASDQGRLDKYRDYLAQMYPTTGIEYTVGEPVQANQTLTAQGDGWGEALDQLASQHEQDDAPADVYYYGLFEPTESINQFCKGSCVAGLGFVVGTQSFARHQRASLGLSFATRGSSETLAHELGHNHGRPHSPCGGVGGPDENFPHPGAKIGWWGFEAPDTLHDPAEATDIMGYCDDAWVSDYVYRYFTDRVALMNGALSELPPPGGMQHFLFLLTGVSGPRWGLERQAPRYPSGEPEAANVLDSSGNVLATVTVYRTAMDHLGGALLLVPDPEPGWHAIQVQGEVPLPFGGQTSSQP